MPASLPTGMGVLHPPVPSLCLPAWLGRRRGSAAGAGRPPSSPNLDHSLSGQCNVYICLQWHSRKHLAGGSYRHSPSTHQACLLEPGRRERRDATRHTRGMREDAKRRREAATVTTATRHTIGDKACLACQAPVSLFQKCRGKKRQAEVCEHAKTTHPAARGCMNQNQIEEEIYIDIEWNGRVHHHHSHFQVEFGVGFQRQASQSLQAEKVPVTVLREGTSSLLSQSKPPLFSSVPFPKMPTPSQLFFFFFFPPSSTPTGRLDRIFSIDRQNHYLPERESRIRV